MEFYEAAADKDTDVFAAAEALAGKFAIANILITRSQDGMTLVGKDASADFPTEAKDVFDVSGAGDTVIAVVSAFLAVGMPLADAVRSANIAAGIAVSKFGTYMVSLNEILSAISHAYSKKIMTKSEAADFTERCKNDHKKVVFTNGCFDILHTGHISLLEQARAKGDVLIVGLNSDASVKRVKGEDRPINNEFDRAKIISALETVDAVVAFEEDTPFELICSLVPNVLVKGADYTIDNVVGADIVQENGGEVVLIPLVQEKSTTRIIEKTKQ
jgi:D-beta-D-heptose 7-phosphate kinase/D-beta-D-heptose 1-phosphate adenosyltransferase